MKIRRRGSVKETLPPYFNLVLLALCNQTGELQPLVLVALLLVELGRGLQKQCNALAVGKTCRKIGRSEREGSLLRVVRQLQALYPCLQELLLTVFEQSRCRIGNIHPPLAAAPGDAVDYYEMLLVPVDDAWQVGFVAQLMPRDLDPRRAETDRLRGIADAQQRDPFTCDMARSRRVCSE